MSYKEIQVPSSVVKEAYSKALAELEHLVESHRLKYAEKREVYDKHTSAMLATYKRLKAQTRDARVYVPDPDSYFFGPRVSPVHQFIADCKSVLRGAEMADEMTLTEAQVNDLEYYREGKAVEDCNHWFHAEVYLYNPYKDFVIEERFKKKQKRVIPETQPGGFWTGFFGFGTLLLLALFLIL